MRSSNMINNNINNNFRKFIPITIVGTLTLIQGLLGVGVLCFVYFAFDCEPKLINLGYILYFKYFGGNRCDLSVQNSRSIGTSTSHFAVTNGILQSSTRSLSLKDFYAFLPDDVVVARRVYFEAILYGVLSILWIVTSFLVLVSCFCKCNGKIPFSIFFVPWFVVILGGCLLDIAATILHIRDIVNTRTKIKTLEYFGIQNPNELHEVSNFSNDYLHLPIIVTCITSKLLILWLINLFGSFLVLKRAKRMIYNSLEYNKGITQRETSYGNSNDDNNEHSCGVQTEDAELSSKDQKSSENIPERASSFSYINPKKIVRYDSITSEQSSNVPTTLIGPHYIYPKKIVREDSILSKQSSGSATKRHRESQLSNNDSAKRSSTNSSVSRVQSAKEKLHLTQELRGQLPWSYLSSPKDDLGTSIRALAHHEYHEISPPVPVPDYDVNTRSSTYHSGDPAGSIQSTHK